MANDLYKAKCNKVVRHAARMYKDKWLTEHFREIQKNCRTEENETDKLKTRTWRKMANNNKIDKK